MIGLSFGREVLKILRALSGEWDLRMASVRDECEENEEEEEDIHFKKIKRVCFLLNTIEYFNIASLVTRASRGLYFNMK